MPETGFDFLELLESDVATGAAAFGDIERPYCSSIFLVLVSDVADIEIGFDQMMDEMKPSSASTGTSISTSP